jgi:hypothetical protein
MALSTRTLVQRLLAKVISKPGVDIFMRKDIKNFLYKYGKELKSSTQPGEPGSENFVKIVQDDLLDAYNFWFGPVANDLAEIEFPFQENMTTTQEICTFNYNGGQYAKYGYLFTTDMGRWNFNNVQFKFIDSTTQELLATFTNLEEMNDRCVYGVCERPNSLGFPVILPSIPQVTLIVEPTAADNFLEIQANTPVNLITYAYYPFD